MSHTILACFAHPDDEAFGVAGTLIQHARQGDRVVLICATRGEQGEISDPALATPDNLGFVREQEMRCAAETIGLSELIFLDYRDSGMAGTEANHHPRAFMNAEAEVVVPHLVAAMRRLQPDAVFTFEPNGGYGHPDHIAIHRHTVAAFHAANDPERYPQVGEPYQPGRLIYVTIPASQIERLQDALAAAGQETSPFDDFLENIRWPEERINMSIDVSDVVDAKWATISCHATQVGENHPFRLIPRADFNAAMGTEYFSFVWPQPDSDVQFSSIFGGGPTPY